MGFLIPRWCPGLVLIERDNKPIWTHTAIEDVTDEEVAAYFEPVENDLYM